MGNIPDCSTLVCNVFSSVLYDRTLLTAFWVFPRILARPLRVLCCKMTVCVVCVVGSFGSFTGSPCGAGVGYTVVVDGVMRLVVVVQHSGLLVVELLEGRVHFPKFLACAGMAVSRF